MAPLAAKAVKEIAYHRDHAQQWTLRLGDGTDESHARMQRGLDPSGASPANSSSRWTDWTSPGRPARRMDDAHHRRPWAAPPSPSPKAPQRGAWTAGEGRQGLHTEPFGRMLAEMQHLHRSHPGATW